YIESGRGADVFIISGAEDLVPVLDAATNWTHPAPQRTLPDGSKWIVERFRPRIEGLFARIERWTPVGGGASHWHSISTERVVPRYGSTGESRIADPDDSSRVFSWLLCESHDMKGNAMQFDYVAEDSTGIDLAQAHERNRAPATRQVNRYLKSVRYGNA